MAEMPENQAKRSREQPASDSAHTILLCVTPGGGHTVTTAHQWQYKAIPLSHANLTDSIEAAQLSQLGALLRRSSMQGGGALLEVGAIDKTKK